MDSVYHRIYLSIDFVFNPVRGRRKPSIFNRLQEIANEREHGEWSVYSCDRKQQLFDGMVLFSQDIHYMAWRILGHACLSSMHARIFASRLCNTSISKVCPNWNLDLQSIHFVTGHDEEFMMAILVESSRIFSNSVSLLAASICK